MRAGMVLLMPRLRRFARALTGSWHQADDLVQDTIVRAMASWNDATRLIYMEGWVLRIMRNAWIDMQRARRVRLEYADAFRMWSRSASNDEDAAVARLTLGTVEAALGHCPRISAPFFCSSVWRTCPTRRPRRSWKSRSAP